MNPNTFLKSQLRHVLTLVGGFGAFLLSKDLVLPDGAEAVNEGVAQAVTGVFAIAGAMLSRLLIVLVARFPFLSFLENSVTENSVTENEQEKSSGRGSGQSLSLVLLFCLLSASFCLQFLSGCQALEQVGSVKGRLMVTNADRSAKGGLIFEDGQTGAFGRLVSDDGNVVEVELFPILNEEEAPIAPLLEPTSQAVVVTPSK